MRKKIIITIIIIASSIIIFFNRNSYIESFLWKSNSLNKISDFMEFNEKGYNINGKKIIYKNKKHGTILFCLYRYLIVTNSQGKLCLYSNKGEVNDYMVN
jgi:hypothetical protein